MGSREGYFSLNWKTVGQVALDGISMAVGASAAKVGVQIAVNVGTSIGSGFINGDDMSEIVMQAGTSAVLAGIGGDGADYAGKRFREKMLATYDNYDKIGRLDVAAAIYRSEKNNFKRKNVVNVEKTVISTGASYGKATYTYYSSSWTLFAHSVRYLSNRIEYVKMYYKDGEYKNVVYRTVWK